MIPPIWLSFFSGAYALALLGLSFFGFWGCVTLGHYWRSRHHPTLIRELRQPYPTVTVQLPIYNEKYVVERLIQTAVALDYPPNALQIQILDDSTDDTTPLAAHWVAHYQKLGYAIELYHRDHQEGFKAGALQAGMAHATGDFIAIFDADFLPPADFLQRTIPPFQADPQLGLVQTRWGHLNAPASYLTGAQALALDKHFLDQKARFAVNYFPKFNGSAGIWRRQCLEEAGGWQMDTVTEDLCLSIRARQQGWLFLFLADLISPAELPTTIPAYKNQQARWAKGSVQCLLKYGGDVWHNPHDSWGARLYGLVSLTMYATYFCVLLLLIVEIPLLYAGYHFSRYLVWWGLLGLSQPILLIVSQLSFYKQGARHWRYLPLLLSLSIGIAPAVSRAMLSAMIWPHQEHRFVRTPKTGEKKGITPYRLPFDWILLVEIGFAIYTASGWWLAWQGKNYGALLLLTTAVIGFVYVAAAGIAQLRHP